MIELFDKKFVHFMWDDELKGKDCFVAGNIEDLIFAVRNDGKCGVKTNALHPSSRASLPFLESVFNNCYPFAYFDPNYEAKKAFNEGKAIQFKDDVSGEWCPAYNPRWDLNIEYRIKPKEDKWIAYLARENNKPCYLSACTDAYWESAQKEFNAKTKLFVGTYDEVSAWFESRQKFAEVIKAWEDGKTIQFLNPVDNNWVMIIRPIWEIDIKYRVKPEEEMNDKMNPIQGNKMRRYNLNLGDWDELKEMAVKMFKGMAVLNERFAKKISEGEFVTQDDWKEMNGLWQTFNYINDDKKFCKEDLHHLFTDDLDEEFVEIKAEEAEEKKKWHPYINSVEMIADFIARFKVDCPPYCEPSIWVKEKETDARYLIDAFRERSVRINNERLAYDFASMFEGFVYLDGSPVGMKC